MWLKHSLFLILTILSTIYSNGNFDRYGYTIPSGDINLEYGKGEINITCIITDKTFIEQRKLDPNPRDFVFSIRNKPVPEDQIKRINSTVIQYINKNPDIMEEFIYCDYKNISIRMTSVLVGTKPNNVKDTFDCIGYNLENFTCSWTPDQKSKYTVYYTLTEYYNIHTQRHTECGKYINDDVNNITSCIWNSSKNTLYRSSHDIIFFNLIGRNLLGVSNETIKIEHYKKIKTSPPANLRVENSTLSSLFLSWEIPESMVATHVFLEHKIMYTFDERGFKTAKVFTTNCGSKVIYANLTDLPYAYVLYDVRVVMRLNATANDTNADKMWSENSFVFHQTNATLPGAPIANIRGFYYNSDHDRVVIYWKQVNPLYRNGGNFSYIVRNKMKYSEPFPTTQNGYLEISNLNTSREHVFEIRSLNDVGQSHNYSQIVIPPLNNTEMEMDFPILKEYSVTQYELSWSKPIKGAEHLVNYTVYWCDSSRHSQFHLCSNISWATVPPDVTSYNISVSVNSNVEMAISANGKHTSTSMKWPDCFVRHEDKYLHKSLIYLDDSTATATEITISWKLRCMDTRKQITGYVIEYCVKYEITSEYCQGPKKNETISGNVQSYTIKNLEPYTTYRIKVLMRDNEGTFSPSNKRFVTTTEGTPSSPTDLIVTGVTNSSITFEWSLPKKLNSKVIRSFEVKYNNKIMVFNQTIPTGSSDPIPTQNFTLNNLLSYETYDISIKACISVRCSNYSDIVSARTKIGRPSRIDKIHYYSLNNSVTWEKPFPPGGNIDYYEIEVSLDEKLLYKRPQRLNTTIHILNKCGDNSPYSTVSYKIRAINIGENAEIYASDWSKEEKQICQKIIDYNFAVYITLGFLTCLFIGMVFVVFGKKFYIYFITMKDVQFQLPDGLYENKDRFPRGNELDFIKEPPGDDQFLLCDKDGIKRSGDSSGCSSGQDSAESDSGTSLGSSTDSGTEQPRTKDDDHLVEAVPLEDFSLSTSGNGPTSYCQLGYPSSHSDSKDMTPFSFPKIDVPLIRNNESTSGSDISPYIRCEQVMDSNRPINSGYVANPIPASGYVPHTVEEKKSGYVPHPNVDKNTGYVMAAEKNSIISPSTENKGYVQVADVSNSQILNNENLPRTNGYVSYGDVKSLPSSPEMKGTSAYVPHKQLDEVLNK